MQSERASLLLPGQLCASSFHNIPSTLMISLSPQDGRPHFLPDHHNDVHLRCPRHTSAALNSRCHVPCLFKVRGSISLLRGCMLESSSQLSHLQKTLCMQPQTEGALLWRTRQPLTHTLLLSMLVIPLPDGPQGPCHPSNYLPKAFRVWLKPPPPNTSRVGITSFSTFPQSVLPGVWVLSSYC